MVEACELKTLQRGAGSGLQIVERRSKPGNGHGQSSDLRAGPERAGQCEYLCTVLSCHDSCLVHHCGYAVDNWGGARGGVCNKGVDHVHVIAWRVR